MHWRATTAARGGLKRWLQASGSLSARLAGMADLKLAAGEGAGFSVRVLWQGRAPLSTDEACALGHGWQRVGYVREVLLHVNGCAVVFARSVTAHTDSVGAWRSVRGLGSRPLADVLFKSAAIARQPLQFKTLAARTPMRQHVQRAVTQAAGVPLSARTLMARRSVFRRHAGALLVMEVFIAPSNVWHCPSGFALKSSARKIKP
ncbi:chorismate lyase [Rhodoferax sp.]|uniref:chorismate--pyruvate lyase family protein n=1 Tax=Rhodoferax sp. TaxID=50421 RepID=UPI0026187CC5|nr:chorismate lyase [Rhodoferax sp.]MDD5481202.1 chorismate lyase [Rhodoferax sp.]